MTPQSIDLSGLKDIHPPIEPSFWPLAVGWWGVIGGVFIVLTIVAFLVYRHRFDSKRYAKRLLKSAYRSALNPQTFAFQISVLFKRIALARWSQEEVASLSDKAWATFIRQAGKNAIPEKMAHFIAHAAYAPPAKSVAFSNESLYNAANKWIDIVFKGKQHEHK